MLPKFTLPSHDLVFPRLFCGFDASFCCFPLALNKHEEMSAKGAHQEDIKERKKHKKG